MAEIEIEVYYLIEMTPKGDNDWCVLDGNTFDSLASCRARLAAWIKNIRDTDEIDYRIVRRTVTTEPVMNNE